MASSLASDISEALRSNTAALSAFEGLPPSRKGEYLDGIDEAGGPMPARAGLRA
jgi:hypothetical protein